MRPSLLGSAIATGHLSLLALPESVSFIFSQILGAYRARVVEDRLLISTVLCQNLTEATRGFGIALACWLVSNIGTPQLGTSRHHYR